MSRYYQDLDRPGFDYELHRLPGVPRWLRGPAFDPKPGTYIACIGAAQTFGRFCAEPFTQQLSRELGLPVLNLAIGGAGPAFYRQPNLLKYLQGARLVIAQVLSGRSASNSEFTTDGDIQGTVRRTGETSRLEPFLRELFDNGEHDLLRRVIAESRTDWATQFAALLEQDLQVPSILLWWAARKPRYRESWRSFPKLLGDFPQLIQPEQVEIVRSVATHYVEHVSKTGLPQRLWTADEAVPGTVRHRDGALYNEYYPSPEMHAEVAASLLPLCRKALG